MSDDDVLEPDELLRSGLPDTVELTSLNVLEAALAERRRAWSEGKRAPAGEHLRANPTIAGNGAWAAEIIYDEFVLRQEVGDSPSWDAYLVGFPQYAEQLEALRLADLIVGDTLGPPAGHGTQFGDYELLEQIGQGGMGVVYKAVQRSLGRTVAVKMLRSSGFAPQGELDRLLKEMSAASSLNHPNIVHVYSVGERADQPFIVFEFVDGPSLAQRIGGTPLSARTSAIIVAAVSLAVQYANERGIIHRDLKPANVMLSGPADQPLPKVTDFGASKQICDSTSQQLSQIIGTPSYMAPEQLDGRIGLLGATTDVYGLGTVLYECLTGMPPFRGGSAAEILRQVAEEPPVAPRLINPAAPGDLDTICLKCLSKNSRDRYASAKEVADELNRFLTNMPIKARPPGAIRLVSHWCGRNPLAAVLSGLLLAAVSAGVAGIVVQWRRAETAWQTAETARRDAVANQGATQQLLDDLMQSSNLAGVQGEPQERDKITALARAAVLCKSILERSPTNLDLRITLTDVYGQLGTLCFYDGRIGKMSDWYQKARDLWQCEESAAPDTFERRHCIAEIDAWQSWASRENGNFSGAFNLELRAVERFQDLLDERPGNVKVMAQLVGGRISLLSAVTNKHTREESVHTLQRQKVELSRLLGTDQTSKSLRRRLALTTLLLAANQDAESTSGNSEGLWREAHQHYRVLVSSNPNDLLCKEWLADCCSKLLKPKTTDSYYRESVGLLQDVAGRFREISAPSPSLSKWLRTLAAQNYCLLISNHLKAGNTPEAEATYETSLHSLTKELAGWRVGAADVELAGKLATFAEQFGKAGRTNGALLMARDAAAVVSKDLPERKSDLTYARDRGTVRLSISKILKQLGDDPLARQQAELGERIYAACDHIGTMN